MSSVENRFKEEYVRLNPAQRQAVDTIDGPVLVIAGPGTGKTQLLSMRVANILRQTDVNASNILCLTFTESGQQAIQRRLLELVGELANNVGVHTFHGFGTAVITANSTYFYEAVASHAADDLTLFETLHTIFEHLPHAGPLSSHDGEEYLFLKDAQQRISQLKTAGITPENLRQIIVADQTWCRLATPLIQAVYQQFGRFHKKYIPLFQNLANDLSQLKVITNDIEWLQPLAHLCQTELTAALKLVEVTKSTTSITAWKTHWLEIVNGEMQLKATAQYQRLQVLADIYAQYIDALRQQEQFDYDDMILEVLQALGSQPDLLAGLQEQYQYILVDEYQDTNGAQARLLELLADNPVHEGRPNIMVVGDDDQAIYGFQGADANVMLRFREHWRDVTTIVLTDNYRSSQAILDNTRQLILQGSTRLENFYGDIVKQLISRTDIANYKPRLVDTGGEAKQNQWLTSELQRLIASGTAPNEIAIIAPRHKYLQRLLPYLLEANINISYERQTNVLQEPNVVKFMQLCKLVDAVAKNYRSEVQSLLPEVLSYGWWGISRAQIWQISLSKNKKDTHFWLDQMLESEDEDLGQFASWLIDIAEESKSELLETILIKLTMQLKDTIENVHLQLTTITRGLKLYRPDQMLKLHDFVTYVTLCHQAKLPVEAKQIIETGRNAVHLMTAHKAKGLEFGYVFIIYATEYIWLSEKGIINKISLPANLAIQPAGETNDDRLRLLYVAATRPRQQLTFVTFAVANDNKEHQLLSWLATPAVQKTLVPLKPTIDYSTPLAIVPIYDWRQLHHEGLKESALQAYLQPGLQHYRLSPTHLTTFLDVSQGGPRQFLTRHLLQFPEAVSLNMLYGNVIHKLLDQVQNSLISNDRLPSIDVLIGLLREGLEGYGLREVDYTKAFERGKRTLQYYLEQRSEDFTKQNLSEQNFWSEDITFGIARITGKIDRLTLDKVTNQAIITDFKTGKAFSKWQATNGYDKLKLHKFEQQLLFYKLLMEHSKSFRKFTVTQGKLEFVEPDQWGRISTLNYDYQSAALNRLEQLIKIIWNKIMKLNLPDTSHYSPDYQGTVNFEQDLLDNKI